MSQGWQACCKAELHCEKQHSATTLHVEEKLQHKVFHTGGKAVEVFLHREAVCARGADMYMN